MKNKRRECKRAAAMLLAALMVVNSVDLSAFTAYAKEKTEQSASSKECVMTITDFEELEEDVMQQLLPVGASEEEIIFPDTLNVTVSVSDTQEEKDTTDNEEDVSEGESESKETVSGNAVSETSEPEVEESDVTGSKSETEQTPETKEETESETGESVSETPEPEGEESNTTDIDNTETASIFQTVLSAFAPMTVYAAEEKGTNEGEATQTKNVTLTGITWEIDAAESDGEVFDSCEDCDGYCYVYTPVLPETDEDGNKVTLGDNVELPVIYVLIGEGEDHVSAIDVEGYTEEGFCTAWEWADGTLKKKDGETCTHGDDCNGYQPAVLEDYDVDGDGTDEQAYKITNAGQLYWFAAYVNEGGENLNANAYLANGITINENLLNSITTDENGKVTNDNGARKWVPIGNYASSNTLIYKGVFNGNNHSIKGIYINEASKQYQGLFGMSEGNVQFFTVADSMLRGLNRIGGIVGENKGNVKKCIYAGYVFSEDKNTGNASMAGGIVGWNNKGKIEECKNLGKVTGYLGDIGGISGDNMGEINACVNEGEILNQYPKMIDEIYGAVGGIAGSNVCWDGARGNVKNCVNHGSVEGKTSDYEIYPAYTGGIIGLNDGGKIDGCWNDGEIKGKYTGGICGYNENIVSGGVEGEIQNSYNTGVIESGYGICRYTDYDDGSNVKNCYTSSSKVAYFDKHVNGIEAGYTNVYYLSVNDDDKALETDNSSGTTAMTADDFASGKVAYLLNQGQESTVWYQNIDSGTADSYPVLDSSHRIVYASSPCPSEFSNTQPGEKSHDFKPDSEDDTEHICENCGEKVAHSGVVYKSDETNQDTIIVSCSCGYNYGSIVLKAPAAGETGLVYDSNEKAATVDTTTNLTLPTGVTISVTEADVTYSKVESGTETSLNEQKPTNAGTYKASLTLTGDDENTATAVVTYEITAATPTVAWSDTSKTVYYTGKTISSNKLPALTVKGVGGNAVTGYTTDDFTYYYREFGSDGEFTEGLPEDRGTYDIKATVKEKGNYAGAETTEGNYLKLTIKWLETEETATLTDQYGRKLSGDDWWAQSVTFTAPDGWTICKDVNETYKGSFTFDNGGADTGSDGVSVTYYLKNSDGEIAEKTATVRIDRTVPTFPDEGNYGIQIKDNWFKSLLNTITFNLFYKENVEVTVNAEDALSGIASYHYWVDTPGSTTVLTAEELNEKTFTETDNAKIDTITQDSKCVYYVYVEDKAGNRSNYICSNGVVVDMTEPTVSVTADTQDVTASVTVTATDSGSGLESTYYLYYSTNSLDGMTAEQIIEDSRTQSNATGEFSLTGLYCATTYHYAVVVKDRAGNAALQKGTFTTEKIIPEFDASDIPTISGTYGQSLYEMTLSKKTDTSNNGIAGTWKITEANAGSIYPTVNGTKKYEVTFTPAEESKFAPYTEQTTVSVTPKELTVSAVSAQGREFEPNNNKVGIMVKLSGIKDGDTVEVANADSLQGTINSPDAGTYKKVILPTITLTGEDSDNYTLPDTSGEFTLTSDVVISQATYYNWSVKKQYLYSKPYENETIPLSDYLPEGYGKESYGEPSCTPTDGIVSGCSRDDKKLSYTVNQADTSGGSAEIKITVDTKNYKQYTITIKIQHIDKYPVILKPNTSVTLKDSNLTYGEPLSNLEFNDAVFVSKDDPNQIVSGTLAWTYPDTKPDAGTTNAQWTFTPDNSDYATVSGNVSITVSKATAVYTPPTVEGVVNYHPEHTLSGIALMNGAVTGVDGSPLQGSWSWETPDQVPQVNNSGYRAVFTPNGTTNYKTVTCTITVTVAKATPYIAADPIAAGITYGKTLGSSALTGGTVQYSDSDTASVEGNFVWERESTIPKVSDSNTTRYTVIFKPTASDNYNEVETEITITVNKAENAPNMPGSTMSVANSCKTVGAVELPGDWEWDTGEAAKALTVGVPLTATAVYKGADKGNYENESVDITITRSACDHVPGEILYTGTGEHAPDCVNDGLGHTECTKCHEITESGIVVVALGHQGGTATCKKRAVCTVCHQEYGSTNPNNHAATEVKGHKNADCTSAGYTGDTHCADCGTKMKSGTVVAALGHDYKNEVTTEPTTTSTGVRTYTCDRCGHSYTRAIAKLANSGDKPGNDNQQDNTNKPGSNNQPDNTDKPDDTGKPDTGKPYIEGKADKNGWENIKDQLDDAKEKDTVTVDMNGTTVVPGDVFASIRGKDVNVVFDMGDGITWTVNGKDITADKVGDIDFGVTVGSQAGKNIPVDIINNVTGERYSMNVSLAYDGEFGFKATLSLNVGKENAGLYANLFYYNPETNSLEYMSAGIIDEEGNAHLDFTHASDYSIVVDTEDMKTEDTGSASDASAVPATADGTDAWNPWWIIIIGAVILIVGIGVFYVVKKKRETEE